MFKAILYIYDEDGTLDEIPDLLEALPRNIEDLYSAMLKRFTKGDNERLARAKRVFQCILYSQRLLTLQELEEAISISPDQKSWRTPSPKLDASRLSKLCGNLVKYDHMDNTVSLAHHTVFQFLQSHSGDNSRILIEEAESEQYLAQICLTYLSFADFQKALTRTLNSEQLLPTKQPLSFMERALPGPMRPFARYARGQKVKQNPSYDISSALRNELIACQRSNTNTSFELLEYCKSHWITHCRHLDLEHPKQKAALRTFTLQSHPWKEVLPWSSSDNKEPLPKWYMFQWTVYSGHKVLHQVWRELTRPAKEIEYWKYLWQDDFSQKFAVACRTAQLDQVDIILNAQRTMLDLNSESPYGYPQGGPVVEKELHFNFVRACSEGNDLIVERLLQEDFDPTSHTWINLEYNRPEHLSSSGPHCLRTGLQAAAQCGHLSTIELLLAKTAHLDDSAQGDEGRTALQAAAGLGYPGIVTRLIEAGHDVNENTYVFVTGGRSALQAASEYGFITCVERLLQAGARVNAELSQIYGYSALFLAALEGHDTIVKLLLSKGARLAKNESKDDLHRLVLSNVICGKGILYNWKGVRYIGKHGSV